MSITGSLFMALGVFLLLISLGYMGYAQTTGYDEDGKCYDKYSNEIKNVVCKVTKYEVDPSYGAFPLIIGFSLLIIGIIRRTFEE